MNSYSDQFQDSLKKGQIGERSVIEALSNHTEVRDLTDYENYKAYQQKGLDLEFLNKKTNAWDRVDVKTNVTENSMTFLELYKKEGELGWFHTSKSDWIFLYSVYLREIYYYSINEMRNYVSNGLLQGELKVSNLRNGAIGLWIHVLDIPLIKKFK